MFQFINQREGTPASVDFRYIKHENAIYRRKQTEVYMT